MSLDAGCERREMHRIAVNSGDANIFNGIFEQQKSTQIAAKSARNCMKTTRPSGVYRNCIYHARLCCGLYLSFTAQSQAAALLSPSKKASRIQGIIWGMLPMVRATANALFMALVLVVSAALPPAVANGLSEQKVRAFHGRVSALHREGHYAEALKAAEEWVKAAEKSEFQKPGISTAKALGVTAWQALFAKRPEQALAASERAMALSPGTVWIKTNYAHALLFLGRTDEAIVAYTAHRGRIFWGKTSWEAAIRKDFADFRAHGLGRPELKRVEEALSKTGAAEAAPRAEVAAPKAAASAPKAAEAGPKAAAAAPKAAAAAPKAAEAGPKAAEAAPKAGAAAPKAAEVAPKAAAVAPKAAEAAPKAAAAAPKAAAVAPKAAEAGPKAAEVAPKAAAVAPRAAEAAPKAAAVAPRAAEVAPKAAEVAPKAAAVAPRAAEAAPKAAAVAPRAAEVAPKAAEAAPKAAAAAPKAAEVAPKAAAVAPSAAEAAPKAAEAAPKAAAAAPKPAAVAPKAAEAAPKAAVAAPKAGVTTPEAAETPSKAPASAITR